MSRSVPPRGRDRRPVVPPVRRAPKKTQKALPKVPVMAGRRAWKILLRLRFTMPYRQRTMFWEMLQRRCTPKEDRDQGPLLPWPAVLEYVTPEDILAVYEEITSAAR